MAGQRLMGFIRRPGADQIRELAAMEYMHPTDAEVAEIEGLLDEALAMFDRLDELPQPAFQTAYRERDPGRRRCPRRTRTTPSFAAAGWSGGRPAGLPAGPSASRTTSASRACR